MPRNLATLKSHIHVNAGLIPIHPCKVHTVFPRNLAAARFNFKSLHPAAKFRGRRDFEGGN